MRTEGEFIVVEGVKRDRDAKREVRSWGLVREPGGGAEAGGSTGEPGRGGEPGRWEAAGAVDAKTSGAGGGGRCSFGFADMGR